MAFTFETLIGILLAAAVGLWIVYLIIRAAVKSGTQDIVSQLKKNQKDRVS